MSEQAEKFEQWAVVEIMGHVRVAGRVSEQALFGTVLLRVDIPDGETFMTRYFGGSSIYSLSPCSEEAARSVAAYKRQEPVYRYELSQLQAASAPSAVPVYADDRTNRWGHTPEDEEFHEEAYEEDPDDEFEDEDEEVADDDL